MDEVTLTPEEFDELVDVFTILRRWRDQRNARLMETEPDEILETERTAHALEH